MTEISDEETAEVLWTSSEQGSAAVKAACDQARSSGVLMTGAHLTESDISAIVYAAYEAAGWDGEPADGAAPAHLHSWTTLGVKPTVSPVLFSKPSPYTIVLIRCAGCGEPDTRTLPGEWTLEDLKAAEATS